MKLYDFTLDESLNEIRHKMRATDLGSFELFDPQQHLSWQEKQSLAKQWVNIESNNLRSGYENILYFKNSPVVIKVNKVFHFSLCDDIKKRINQGDLVDVNATTSQKLMHNAVNCPYCLHTIGYQGFDAYRQRHQQYNEKILNDFNLSQFIVTKSPAFNTQ